MVNYLYGQAPLLRRILSDNRITIRILELQLACKPGAFSSASATDNSANRKFTPAGISQSWAELGLFRCTHLESVSVSVALTESNWWSRIYTRSMALTILLLQLPPSVKILNLTLGINGEDLDRMYLDLIQPDWAMIGAYLSYFPALSQVMITLESTTDEDENSLPIHWTHFKRTPFQENLTGFHPSQGTVYTKYMRYAADYRTALGSGESTIVFNRQW